MTSADMDRQKRPALETLPGVFSVCKVKDYSNIDLEAPFVFTGCTDQEKSLVCPMAMVPADTLAREDGWKGFRIAGPLDFSLVGILAEITRTLAEQGISVFAISTFNTDYVFVKESSFEKAIEALEAPE